MAMKLPPTEPHPELDRMLEDLVNRPLTPRERWMQRVSFVFGQMMDCSPDITREQVEERATAIYGPCPD